MGRADMRVGPARHDLGPARHEPARGPARSGLLFATWAAGLSWSRNFISGPHRHETAWAGPRAERSFPLFFYPKTVKNTKIQHKTWAGPRARGPGPGTNFLNFKPRMARPATHGPRPGPTRHLLKPAGRAREQAQPMPTST